MSEAAFDPKAHWEQVYQNRSPREVSWYQSEPDLSISLIQNSGFDRSVPLIDVGGGASVLVDRLLALGYEQLAVLDISGRALAHAKQRLGKKAAAVDWFEADVTRFQAPRPFALWHDRAVFHFLVREDQRQQYREALCNSLAIGGQVIIAAFAIGGPTQCSGLDIVQYDAQKLRETLGAAFQWLESQEEDHRTPAGKVQPFGYHRFRYLGA